ncbi:MAG: TonB-dependent receptor [Vicingaceae bacterium]|nr:TonB-dependent receptor [Vicingaceae bacterium]
MKKLTTTLILLTFVMSSIIAQTGEVKGIIKDKETGKPIWNVSVYIELGGNLVGDAADFDGKYTIKPLNSGVYTIVAKMTGYAPMKIHNVQVTSDKISYVNIDMETAATEIDEFVFIEVIHEIPLIDPDEPHVKMLTAKMLKNDPNIHNPTEMLNKIEGVTVAPNGRDVYVRGSRPQATQFITDGMKSITGGIGIPGQAIGSIKVYTGGVPARYGDLSGGVIVTETKSYFDLAQEYQ